MNKIFWIFHQVLKALILNRIWWNFVVMIQKVILCRCAYLQEILIHFFFLASYTHFEQRNFAKIKCSTEIIFHCNSSNPLNSWYANMSPSDKKLRDSDTQVTGKACGPLMESYWAIC